MIVHSRARRLLTSLAIVAGVLLGTAATAAADPSPPKPDAWRWDAPGWGYQVTQDGQWYTSPRGQYHVNDRGGYLAPSPHRTWGGGTGVLGYPTAPLREERVPHGIGLGRYQTFERGVIYDGANGIWGTRDDSAITSVHRALGGGGGPLAYPLGNVVQDAPGWTYQRFESGTIYSSSNGTVAVPAGFDREHRAEGGGRAMGYPTRTVNVDAPGYSWQSFERGIIYCRDLCFAVTGAYRTMHDARGGGTGSLGYPISLATYDGARRTWYQQFERGAVVRGPGGDTVVPGTYR